MKIVGFRTILFPQKEPVSNVKKRVPKSFCGEHRISMALIIVNSKNNFANFDEHQTLSMKHFLLWMGLIVCCACGPSKTIVDKPITFDDERIALTKEYLATRYGLEQETPTIVPQIIVLHWTVVPTMQKTFDVFYDATLPSRPDIATASSLNVSSQFLVDQDGTIYRLMPETTMARHVIGLNHAAIGIENVGGTSDTPLTKAQVKSNVWLVKYLSKKYPIDYLIGHYEYTDFEDHELWLEKDSNYRTEKTDPGEDFMQAVRKGTKNLRLKPAPKKQNTTS